MPQFKPRRQAHYDYLRANYLTPVEARALSVLPKQTPALRALVADRVVRRERFSKLAAAKIRTGKWEQKDVADKWLTNLSRLYHKKRWRSQGLAKGRQKRLPKGAVNPWAMYRDYEKRTPGKGYVSPWEIKQVSEGKTRFDRGQLFVQKARSGVKRETIQHWIDQLTESIRLYRGERRARFIQQRANLRRLL